MNAEINTTMMLKYAVTPISPSWAKPGTKAHALHLKMMKDNIPMITFGTGSKISSLSQVEGKQHDNIFNESNPKDYNTINEDANLTPNAIHLKYLKDVTKTSSKLKRLNTLGTQDRVITLDNLFDNGTLVEGIDKKVAESYIKATNDLTAIYKRELLERIGYKFVDGKYEGNIRTLVSVLRNELELKEIPEQILDMLDVRLNDQLSYDFSVIPVADIIEKTLVNTISKALIKQKTNGEALINVPVTFYNDLWADTKVILDKVAENEANIEKYVGTNGLPYYRRGEIIDKETGKRAKTELAKIAVAFNGDFVNLLNLKDTENKNLKIKDAADPLKRLNELIKTDKFRELHGDKITVAGPRIPTDAINLKEAFEIWHFLPADVGTQVIVPTEIVAKAGSDFDFDKIYFSFPNIDSSGNLVSEVVDFEERLAELKKEGRSVTRLVNQQKKYLQNQWLKNNIEVIKQPENFAALTKPTSDYLVRDYIEKNYTDTETSYNPKKRNVHVKEERMTGTRVGEEQNDLEKHKELLGGNKPLGIGAKKRKQHALYKSIGAKLPKTYTKYNRTGDLKRNFVLNFDHNKTDDGNISISDRLNQDRISIGDVFSHQLQGILDRENETYISKANIIEQSLPVLNRLIESGVSFPIALDFINQPLILEWLEGKVEQSGFVNGILNPTLDSTILSEMAEKLDEDALDILSKAYIYSNEKRVGEVLDNLTNSKFEGKVLVEFMGTRTKYNSFNEFKSRFNNNPGKLTSLSILEPGASRFIEVFRKDFVNKDAPTLEALKRNNYYVSEYLWSNYFDGKNANAEQLRKGIKQGWSGMNSGQQLAALAHYFQIAEQSEGMERLEIFFNPDTKLVDTLVSVSNRKAFITSLEGDSKIDDATLDALTNDSVISSLYENEIFLELVPTLMELRTMPKIVKYISDSLERDRMLIKQRYGSRPQDKERYIAAFNNAVVDYIYQNVMSNFTEKNNPLPVSLPSVIKKQSGDYTVDTEHIGTLKEPINIEGKKIEIDLIKLRKVYNGNFFLNGTKGEFSYSERGKDAFNINQNPFRTFDSFVRYSVEKELLYTIYNREDFSSDSNYEMFISERALSNSYNRSYIMGTTKYSYTKKVLSTIRKYPHLAFKYPVLLQLAESFQGKKVKEGKAEGLSLLELKDKKIITPAQAREYAKNLEDLGDITVQKSNNPNREVALKANKEISDVFANFSLMMYYQQGTGKSSLSFNKALNGVAFTEIMTYAANAFMVRASKASSAEGLDIILNDISDSLLKGSSYKNYLRNADAFLQSDTEDVSVSTDVESLTEAEKLKAQLKIAELQGDTDSVSALKEAIDTEESNEQVKNEQNRLNVAPGVKVISADYGVTSINTKPSESTTAKNVEILKPQISAQLYKENKGVFANAQWNYGLRWTRASKAILPVKINSFATASGNKEFYTYDSVDQNGNPLPPVSTLKPIIDIIEQNTGIDMSNYDSVIANLYEGKEYIYPHKDTSESVTAEGYPVVVYSIGNQSALGIWDDNNGKITFAYSDQAPGPYKGMKPTNEVLTENGTIYTFGMDGNGRFALTHTTPVNAKKDQEYPPITLPDGRVVTNYTITLTFRRAQDLDPGMPKRPGRIVTAADMMGSRDAIGKANAFFRQDLISGQPKYGTLQNANAKAKKALGPNPTSIDMIMAGFRTRTTRAKDHTYRIGTNDQEKLQVGDIIMHMGKDGNGMDRFITSRITAVHPKGSEGWKSTWDKEGWTAEGVKNIERFGDGAAAFEFEVLNISKTKEELESKEQKEVVKPDVIRIPEDYTNHSGGAYGADTFFDLIGREFGVENHNHYKSKDNPNVSKKLRNQNVESVILTDEQMDEAYTALEKIEKKKLQRNRTNDLKARNYFQVKNADAVFAVASLDWSSPKYGIPEATNVKGGTRYAISFAKLAKKPIYVWDVGTESWYDLSKGSTFQSMTETPVLTKNFAGIGSRNLEEYSVLKDNQWVKNPGYVGIKKSNAAQDAIRELYTNTFGQSLVKNNPVEVGRFVQYKDRVFVVLKPTPQGWQIYNPALAGPYAKRSVSLESLKPLDVKADLVIDPKDQKQYLVTPKKAIISLTTGKVMKWAENNGNRKRIAGLAELEVQKPIQELKENQTLSGLSFNEGQTNAINEIISFLNSDSKEFVLKGKAGTGKTTILKEVLLQYAKNMKSKGLDKVVVGAISHQATNVISDTLAKDTDLEFTADVVAKMIGARISEENGKILNDGFTNKGTIIGAKLIIVDEASMINEEVYDQIKKLVRKTDGAKVIYAGDPGQLPPIRSMEGEIYANVNPDALSPTFSIDDSAELVERVRQGEDSPILPYADLFWNNSQANEGAVADPAAGARKSTVQKEGQILFTEQNVGINIAIDEFKKSIDSKNYNLVKYVSYHNRKRHIVNSRIHSAIFGEDANYFEPGTPLVHAQRYGADESVTPKMFKYQNADIVVVEEVVETGEDRYGLPYVDLKVSNLPQYFVSRNIETDVIRVIDWNKLDINVKSFDQKYNQIKRRLWGKYQIKKRNNDPGAKSALEEYRNYSEEYADVSQAYAITSHKSQGSTYNTVIVDEVDIFSASFLSNSDRSNALYTAITRAKNNVVIISNKTTPYQGKATLIEDAPIVVTSIGIDSKLAKYYEGLSKAQMKKLGEPTLESLQEDYNNDSARFGQDSYTIDMYIDYLNDKCN